MIIPSIDIQNGQAVQLVGGKELKLVAGNPLELLEKFSRVNEVAVVDLDAARGTGSNQELIVEMVRRKPCRVGGGIRTLEQAQFWLNAGAQKIILGTAASKELLSALPKERTLAALDAYEGKVAIKGWTQVTEFSIEEKIKELAPYVGGFLITFIEKEGRMQGTALEKAKSLRKLSPENSMTFAGGICTVEEIQALDQIEADAQLGMALYTGKISLTEAFYAVTSIPVGELIPTVVCNERREALGLVYSNYESLEKAIESGEGYYWSRRRGLWRKGDTSGNTQKLLSLKWNCERNSLLAIVEQRNVFCHKNTYSCWENAQGLSALVATLHERKRSAPPESYTARLLNDPALLNAKLIEEMQEFIEAKDRTHIIEEAADVLYFTLVRLVSQGISLTEVEDCLQKRSLRVTRRPGNAKKR